MARLADHAKAITLLHEAAQEMVRQAQTNLDLADNNAAVASALHDLLLDEQARHLRSVS